MPSVCLAVWPAVHARYLPSVCLAVWPAVHARYLPSVCLAVWLAVHARYLPSVCLAGRRLIGVDIWCFPVHPFVSVFSSLLVNNLLMRVGRVAVVAFLPEGEVTLPNFTVCVYNILT